jgi:hypothetical protein
VGTTRNYGCLDANLSFASISSKTVSHGIQVPENHRVDCDLPRKRSQKWSRCGRRLFARDLFLEILEQAPKRYECEAIGFVVMPGDPKRAAKLVP